MSTSRHYLPYRHHLLLVAFILLTTGMVGAASGETAAAQGRISSLHAGFLDPKGVDLFGYSVEHDLTNNFYSFYTFGLPSLAAAGISYYGNYTGNGPAVTVGIGVGSVLYAAVVYQLHVAERHVIKLGGGYTTGVAYTGLFPALSYEVRYE